VLNLEQKIVELLEESNISFAVSDSCTGGSVIKRLTDIPASYAHFRGGMLAVPKADEITMDWAKALAVECRENYAADIGIGIIGDVSRKDESGANVVHLALTDGESFTCETLELEMWHANTYTRHIVGNHTLNMMRKYILKH